MSTATAAPVVLAIEDAADFLAVKINGVPLDIDVAEATEAFVAIDRRHGRDKAAANGAVPQTTSAFLADVRDWLKSRYPEIQRMGINAAGQIYAAVCEALEALKKNTDLTPGSPTSTESTPAAGAEPVNLRSSKTSPAAALKNSSSSAISVG